MKKIMIIEDDADLQSILREFLTQEGFEVISYADKNSVKGVIINRPDLVLLDERLADGLGHELCKQIKEHALTDGLPVILMSGLDSLEQLQVDCGADDFLLKPFDLNDLLMKISKYLH